MASIGQIVVGRPPGTRTEIKRHFDLLSAESAGPDGLPALPHAALPAQARH
ncbi:hypothetical protein [Peterkaempfera sp. SMS 1(5)a]|uniref:hypothetical protein n=1 Tax=Peterkaempfera podocarpi TaxID=3232308 RepID=UPI003671468F